MNEVFLPKDEIVAFCRRNHVRRLSIFGSATREDFRPDSDVDFLVELEPGHVPGLRFFALERELSELLGRRVDLHTPASLSPFFRDEVLAEAKIQFELA